MLARYALAAALAVIVAGGGGCAKQPPVAGPSYVHNYPHPVPGDYVYRTERVFGPPPTVGERTSAMAAGLFDDDHGKAGGGDAAGASPGEGLRQRVRQLARELLAGAREPVADNAVVTVSTFVNLNRLYATSGLGRLLGEAMIGELQRAGVEVIDVRKTPGIMISDRHGEYGLSRDMDELSFVHAAQAMVVGTYTVADGEIFVNARLLRNTDGMVLSSAGLVYGLDGISRDLLADESMPLGAGRAVAVRDFADRAAAGEAGQ